MAQAETKPKPLEELPEFLTSAEVARILRVDQRTVTALAKANKLPCAFQVGCQWRFSNRKLREML